MADNKEFDYNIKNEEGEKADPPQYAYPNSDEEKVADINFDFRDVTGLEGNRTVYRFIASLTPAKIDELVRREFERGNIKDTDVKDVSYTWEYVPYHYNETWDEYCDLVTRELIGPEFIYFIYRGYHDDSSTEYDKITYEKLRQRYPALPPGQVRPPEPNVAELLQKIAILERRSDNLEKVLLPTEP